MRRRSGQLQLPLGEAVAKARSVDKSICTGERKNGEIGRRRECKGALPVFESGDAFAVPPRCVIENAALCSNLLLNIAYIVHTV
jgi:hypothetical protein